jgi:DNA-binding NtrC family response regulator
MPQLEIIAMSGDLSLDLMEASLKNGAQRFLAKPLLAEEITSTLEKIEAVWMMRLLESRGHTHQIRWVGNGIKSQEIKKQVAALRGEEGPLLIEGETGTGKEVLFRLLNQQENNRPFVVVNIASIPENLFESEMFGHVKGAFTGADQQKIGLAEAAHGGDLFLDEIEALPLHQQVKLLRFLESGEIRRVGGKESITVKTRVICASNQTLSELVKKNEFREDLLFRLAGRKINLPPLRERPEDIQELCQFFINKQKPRINKVFANETVEFLKTYTWPGNVRELKRVCEQLCLISPLPIIRPEDARNLLVANSSETEMNRNSLDWSLGLEKLMDLYEKQIIEKCLQREPDIDQAADLLKISRSSLYKKIKDHEIR